MPLHFCMAEHSIYQLLSKINFVILLSTICVPFSTRCIRLRNLRTISYWHCKKCCAFVRSLMPNFVDLDCLAVICQLLMNLYIFLRKSMDLMELYLQLLTPILKVTCCQYQTMRTLLKHWQQHSHCWEFLSIVKVSSKIVGTYSVKHMAISIT